MRITTRLTFEKNHPDLLNVVARVHWTGSAIKQYWARFTYAKWPICPVILPSEWQGVAAMPQGCLPCIFVPWYHARDKYQVEISLVHHSGRFRVWLLPHLFHIKHSWVKPKDFANVIQMTNSLIESKDSELLRNQHEVNSEKHKSYCSMLHVAQLFKDLCWKEFGRVKEWVSGKLCYDHLDLFMIQKPFIGTVGGSIIP